MRVVAFVPAKGESNRIRNKNTVVLDGEYLFKRKLRQLLACPEIDAVYLDTESDKIIELASDLPVKILKRNPKLASNKTDGHELFANECARVQADLYIQCLCTSPFITAETMSRAIKALKQAPKADSLVAVQKRKQYTWEKGRPAYGEGRIPNSVDLPDTVIESMGLYMVRGGKAGAKPKRRFGKDVVLFELTDEEAFDVNWPDDLALAERICAGYRAAHNAKLDAIRPHLCASLLADICKERGIKALLPPGFARVSGRSILGVAKTLELRKLRKGEDVNGIYRALGSYNFIRPGDVIVVQSDVKNRAYFGDLNANIAIRSGAVGAVVDSFTRDSVELNGLEFSVFAKGVYCDDIKFEGTTQAMNRAIKIGDVTINNGDYIYADDDGVLAIPQDVWPSIRHEAMLTLKKEFDIRYAVIMGEDMDKVLGTHGTF
ncbi:MAG: dimethylmenaquinone methyltransferase [Rhodospirillaceae bacterium]|nr:MAG: dimethylmenaquinone methyltransferase [Rhodospirillaceae bacterium]